MTTKPKHTKSLQEMGLYPSAPGNCDCDTHKALRAKDEQIATLTTELQDARKDALASETQWVEHVNALREKHATELAVKDARIAALTKQLEEADIRTDS